MFWGDNAKNKHIASVHEKKGKVPFICDICDAEFTTKGQQKSHKAIVHEGKKPFECNICDYKSGRKQDLKKHEKHIHKKIF